MFSLNDNETLIKTTSYRIETGGTGIINFKLYEVVSPKIEDKFIAAPTEALQLNQPKEEFIIRGSSEEDVISRFVEASRGLASKEMFEKKNNEK